MQDRRGGDGRARLRRGALRHGAADLGQEILRQVGALTIWAKRSDLRMLVASVENPPSIDVDTDLRDAQPLYMIGEALGTLAARPGRVLRVTDAGMNGVIINMTIEEDRLRSAMRGFARNVLLLSLIISLITAGLVYLALIFMIVRPIKRISDNMAAFEDAPEDVARVIPVGGRSDEIGLAERSLARLEAKLAGELRRSKKLAALGLMIAKISHDLRNVLSGAQLFGAHRRAQEPARAALGAPPGRFAAPRHRPVRGHACLRRRPEGGAEADPLSPGAAGGRMLGAGGRRDPQAGHPRQRGAGRLRDHRRSRPDGAGFLNLMRNALQATASGADAGRARAVVTVSATSGARRASSWWPTNGPGLPEEARERLFEPFSASMNRRGSGLGLAIVADILHAHDGDIRLLDSDAGARFEISLPG